MKKNRILGFCLSQLLLLGTVASASGATAPAAPVSLDGEWELSYWPQPEKAVTDPAALSGIEVKTIPAKVPGNVELDLLAAGLIDDPMIGANVNKLRAWEGYQWCYTRRFDAPKLEPGQRAELWFGGSTAWPTSGSTANMRARRPIC